jgi:hypothetical protein
MDEANPDGMELQLYVLPVTGAAPTCVADPWQMALSDPAFAMGNVLTVMTTLFELLHPEAGLFSTTV